MVCAFLLLMFNDTDLKLALILGRAITGVQAFV
jgi:hypothetical protein